MSENNAMPFMPAENIARYVDFMRVLNHNGISLDLESTTSRDQITATKEKPNVFDYLLSDKNTQIEAEEVLTNHLKRIGAY